MASFGRDTAVAETGAIAGFGPQRVVPLPCRKTAKAPPKDDPCRIESRFDASRYAVSVDADVTVPPVALPADVAERST
jgi:hypothetical protein